mmetsp:Transcript_22751/g.31715  ORF Transcript_22751/g.31715 Transcript_22751/m.31715 type:complete len:277 (+) Transcript_22751:217-1047(+)
MSSAISKASYIITSKIHFPEARQTFKTSAYPVTWKASKQAGRSVYASGKGFGKKVTEPPVSNAKPKSVPLQFNIPEEQSQPVPQNIPKPNNPAGNVEALLAESSGKVLPEAPEGSEGRVDIVISNSEIFNLDISSVQKAVEPYLSTEEGIKNLLTKTVGFKIEFQKEEGDPRELCEIPDVRLWFLRLDAAYPWFPAVLDWRAGEMSRYTAMMVPHQISARDGLVFNPEGLELFLNLKLFVCFEWLRQKNIANASAKVRDMLLMLGYATDDALFALL